MIVRDATSSGSGTGTTLTVSHTNTGSSLGLIVNVGLISTGDQVTGVTYNGVAMTLIDTIASSVNRSYLFYLPAPATGTHDIVVSLSGSIFALLNAVSYTGIQQGATPDATSKTTGESVTSLASTLTTIADNAIHVVGFVPDAANVTSITNGTILTGSAGESNPLVLTPAGSHTMTGNWAGANRISVVGASFAPNLGSPSASTSASASSSASKSLSPSASASPSPSLSPSSSASRSASASASRSASASVSPSASASPSGSPSASTSASVSPSASTSASASKSASASSSASLSFSASVSASLSSSVSASASASTSSSLSPSLSQSSSPSASISPSPAVYVNKYLLEGNIYTNRYTSTLS